VTSRIFVATTSFNVAWTVHEQLRLLGKHLTDPHHVFVFDNSTNRATAAEIRDIADKAGASYVPPPTVGPREHTDALNRSADLFRRLDTPDGTVEGQSGAEVTHLLWLDHDIYPTDFVELAPLVNRAGFLAIRQRHAPTGMHYPWPGFLAVSRRWLNGRALNFNGIRGAEKRDDGDAGSMLWPVFETADWTALPPVEHGYRELRPADDVGLQSYAYEFFRFGNGTEWRHAMNVSGWLQVPDPDGRAQLVREMVEAL
jgi:hypothetical protein